MFQKGKHVAPRSSSARPIAIEKPRIAVEGSSKSWGGGGARAKRKSIWSKYQGYNDNFLSVNGGLP